jgi:hypothetical protein
MSNNNSKSDAADTISLGPQDGREGDPLECHRNKCVDVCVAA